MGGADVPTVGFASYSIIDSAQPVKLSSRTAKFDGEGEDVEGEEGDEDGEVEILLFSLFFEEREARRQTAETPY